MQIAVPEPEETGLVRRRRVESRTESVTRSFTPQPKKQEYLLVDGYNIIFAWDELKDLARENMDSARGILLDKLCNYQGMKQIEVIAVFDAYRVIGHETECFDYHNIHVVFTKEAETADSILKNLLHTNASKYQVTVATSDGLEQVIIPWRRMSAAVRQRSACGDGTGRKTAQ